MSAKQHVNKCGGVRNSLDQMRWSFLTISSRALLLLLFISHVLSFPAFQSVDVGIAAWMAGLQACAKASSGNVAATACIRCG